MRRAVAMLNRKLCTLAKCCRNPVNCTRVCVEAMPMTPELEQPHANARTFGAVKHERVWSEVWPAALRWRNSGVDSTGLPTLLELDFKEL